MNKALFGITMLLIVGLFLAGCSNTPGATVGDEQVLQDAANSVQDTPEVYVDEQIIDENATVEIGEMI